jgi:hypothetical protein
MSFQLSRRDVESAYAYANRHMARSRRDPDRGESSVLGKLLTTGEVVGAATAVGVLSGRFGPLNIGGTPVPLDAAGGIALHLIGFWLDSGLSPHLHNFGNGVLAAYGAKAGVGMGTSLRMKAGLSPVAVSGDGEPEQLPGATSGAAAPLTEAELAALAQAVR